MDDLDAYMEAHYGRRLRVGDFVNIPDKTYVHFPWFSHHEADIRYRAYLNPPCDMLVSNYLRHAERSVVAHGLARSATVGYVDKRGSYHEALSHWEDFLARSWQCYELLARLVTSISGRSARDFTIFTDRESREARLNEIHNIAKHMGADVGGPQRIWLDRVGLKCTDRKSGVVGMAYDETGAVVDDIAMWAHHLYDPGRMCDALRHALNDRWADQINFRTDLTRCEDFIVPHCMRCGRPAPRGESDEASHWKRLESGAERHPTLTCPECVSDHGRTAVRTT